GGRVSGLQSLSSSVQSTPEKNGHSDDASRSPELLQEFLKSGPRKELLRTCFDKEKKNSASSKSKMTEALRLSNKTIKKPELRKASSTANSQPSSRKQNRKGENPMRVLPASELPPDLGFSNSWICKNSACRAVLSIDDTFCKRCSCCICHLFDDNKDPSLWLVCTSESGEGDYCGLSCHIECALQREKVGVVDLGQLMQLDGSYCCASCGKVSGILGIKQTFPSNILIAACNKFDDWCDLLATGRCWKKQLSIAKDARRLDVLCYRIYLSYRLLDETSRFKELHEFVRDAKAKLEKEVGPVNGVHAKMARGIVSRLSVAGDIQKLCSLAIEKADEWLATMSNTSPKCQDSRPAACRFLFEEVTSSSVVIILIELSTASPDDIKGYKLWYFKSRDETHTKEPISVFPRTQRRILISNLQPCTEYTFRIVSYTEAGDLGHSEAKCFTKSVEIVHKNPNPAAVMNQKKENTHIEGSSLGSKELPAVGSSGFKVRDLGKILRLAWAQEQGCFEGFCSADVEKCCGASKIIMPETREDDHMPSVSRGLDLNVVSVPDLNEELTPPFESSRDEDNGCCTLEQAVEADDDAASHEIEKNGLARSHGSGDSTWTNGPTGEVPAVDSHTELCRKRVENSHEETHDCDSTLINGSPFRISNDSGSLDENFESCVKIIRWLECEGYINQEFRLKLLTWFSLRSTEQERRVVNTFIQTLIDDPSSLAGQLVDSFSDIISSKRPRNGFCSKLWH
ncbi:Fibronectin type III - like 2, partial [Theobroma cacao]